MAENSNSKKKQKSSSISSNSSSHSNINPKILNSGSIQHVSLSHKPNKLKSTNNNTNSTTDTKNNNSKPTHTSLLNIHDDSEQIFQRGKIKHNNNDNTRNNNISHTHNDTINTHEEDNLFGSKRKKDSDDSNNKKNNKRKSNSTKSDSSHKKKSKSSSNSSHESSNLPIAHHVSTLTYRQLEVGLTLLGAVKRISQIDLGISLPNGLTGSVSIREISDVLTKKIDEFIDSEAKEKPLAPVQLNQLFYIGQLVTVSIIKLDQEKKNHISLTMNPARLHANLSTANLVENLLVTAAVKSIEEKGYLCELNVSDAQISAFLPFNEAPVNEIFKPYTQFTKETRPQALFVGQVLPCLIKSVNKSRTITLTANPALIKDNLIKKNETLELQQLRPGLLTKLTVTSINSDGILGKFFDIFTGSISSLHQPYRTEDWQSHYKINQVLKVRLLYVNMSNKTAAFSMLPHILQWEKCDFGAQYKDGEIIEKASVIKIETKLGLFLTIDNNDSNISENKDQSNGPEETTKETNSPTLFAHISQLDDAQVNHITKKYPLKSSHRSRILHIDYFDGIIRASLQPSVVNAFIFNSNDIKPGMEVTGEIVAVNSSGVIVSLTKSIKALIPKIHCGDIKLSEEIISQKFVIGKTVKARVLYAEPRKILLTCKKKLSSANTIVTSYTDLVPNMTLYGFITNIKDSGLDIEFFNRVKGTVTLEELQKSNLLTHNQKPADIYQSGQVEKVRVISVNPKKNKLFLSFNTKPSSSKDAEANSEENGKKCLPGQILSGSITRIDEGNLYIQSDEFKHIECKLPAGHLTDHYALADSLLKSYTVGEKIEQFLVLSVDRKQKHALVSIKPVLLHEAKSDSIPKSFESVTTGQIYYGYIKQIEKYAVFINFLNNIVAFAPKTALLDQLVSDPGNVFAIHQTVRCKITQVDTTNEKIFGSLKPSETTETDNNMEGLLIHDILQSKHTVEKLNVTKETEMNWSKFKIGGITQAILQRETQETKGSLSYQFPSTSNVTGLALRPYHSNESNQTEFKIGDTHTVGILDIDQIKKKVYVSLKPEFLSDTQTNSSASSKKKKQKSEINSELKVGEEVSAVVQFIRSHYFVLTIPSRNNSFAYAATNTFNTMKVAPLMLKLGDKVEGIVTSVSNSRVELVLNLSKRAAEYKKKALSFYDVDYATTKDLQVGKHIKAKIVDIKDAFVNVSFGENLKQIQGHIHVSELIEHNNNNDPSDKSKSGKKGKKSPKTSESTTESVQPLKVMESKIGEIITTKILSVSKKISTVENTSVDNSEVSTEKKRTKLYVSLTCKPSELAIVGPSNLPRITFDSIQVNHQVYAYIKNIDSSSNAIYVTLAPHLHARIKGFSISEDQEVLENLNQHFKIGQQLKVLITHKDKDRQMIEASLTAQPNSAIQSATVNKGDIVRARVRRIYPGVGLLVELETQQVAQVHITDLHDDFIKNPLSYYREGQIVKAYVLDVQQMKTKSTIVEDETSDDSESDSENEINKKKKGKDKSKSSVQANGNKTTNEAAGKLVISLSLRESRVNNTPNTCTYPEIEDIKSLQSGQLVQGYIKRTDTGAGSFISLNRELIGRVLLKNLSDKFIPQPKDKFPEGKKVIARIIAVDYDNNKIDLTLKKSQINAVHVSPNTIQWENLELNQIVKGEITQVTKFGVFLRIRHSANISGLCHISEVSDKFISDLSKFYSIGDKVKAKIIKLDKQEHKLSFGLKAEYLKDAMEEDEDNNEDDSEIDSDNEKKQQKPSDPDAMVDDDNESDDNEDEDNSDSEELNNESDDSNSDEEVNEEEETEIKQSSKNTNNKAATPSSSKRTQADMDLDTAFQSASALEIGSNSMQLDSNPANNSESDSENEHKDKDSDGMSDDEETHKKESARARKAKKKIEEKKLIEREQSLLDPNRAPESAADFERLISSQPNSSVFCNRTYMAYQINLSEIAAARKIAERALKSINYRENKEKFNVYIAFINLENLYGSEDQLQSILNLALQTNNPEQIYNELANIYVGTNKHEKATETFELLIKKFSENKKSWLNYANYLYQQGKLTESRALLSRALERVLKKDHVELICKFSQLEYNYGSIERGRTLLDNVLANYPKRVDCWSIYIDYEIKYIRNHSKEDETVTESQLSHVRSIFDRIFSLKLSSKKMKFFFKKALQIEKDYGNEETMEAIKEKARNYVAQLQGKEEENNDENQDEE